MKNRVVYAVKIWNVLYHLPLLFPIYQMWMTDIINSRNSKLLIDFPNPSNSVVDVSNWHKWSEFQNIAAPLSSAHFD